MQYMKKIFLLSVIISSLLTVTATSNAGELDNLISKLFPKEKIQTRSVKGSVILSGDVSSVEISDKLERLAQEYYGNNAKVLNFMKINGNQQVMLRVRIGEVTRDVMKNYQNTMSNFEFLASKGLVKVIAEPNLVALSGERAEFVAGGEFPVPVAQKDGNVAVNYKQYGTKIVFTPLVLAKNRIRINVEQELSEMSKDTSMKVSGYNVPSLNIRKAKTTIELAPGESFMIAGLVKDETTGRNSKETELVISVAPYFVDPMKAIDVKLPTDDSFVPSKLDQNFVEVISKGKDTEEVNSEIPLGFIAE